MIELKDRVALVTGAGAGLGRAHAIALSRRGARVAVNDLCPDAAASVAREIAGFGGEALPCAASVADHLAVTAMIDMVESTLGGVDILVNNAGILRDRTFSKMSIEDFRLVVDVHLMGSVYCAKAVWDGMRERGFGRIIFTTSSSGLYGNFGQSNYGAAKAALVGLMQTLGLEGERYGIRVNCLAPSAATGMTEGLYPPELLRHLGAEAVSPAVVALSADDAPNRTILLAGAGRFAQAHIGMTRGLFLGGEEDVAGEVLGNLAAIGDRAGEVVPDSGAEQHRSEVAFFAAAASS